MKVIKNLRDIFRREFSFFCLFPALMWQFIFLYLPLAAILLFSFSNYAQTGKIFTSWTLVHYTKVLQPIYIKVIFHSLLLALLTAICCFLISYPVAYFIALKVRRFRAALLLLLILPSWTNFIVQVYAWFFLLGRGGVFSSFLYKIGFVQEFPQLLNTYFSALVGMVYCYLPFMIFPIFAILEKIDKRLLEASADLGAGRFETLRNVTLPLSMQGIYAGFLLVFVPAFGEFAIPLLLGGAKNVYFGSVISDMFLISRDWATGFALASVGILFLVSFLACISAVLNLFRVLQRYRRKRFERSIEAADVPYGWH